MEQLIILTLATLASAFVGSYLGGYFTRKGENLATHEDIGKLTDQVAAVTRTAKEIEAQITSGLWDRQKRWELKREVLFEATKRLSEFSQALIYLKTLLDVEPSIEENNPAWLQSRNEGLKRFYAALGSMDETRLFVAIVCGRETAKSFDALGLLVGQIAAAINKRDRQIYDKSQPELSEKLYLVRVAIRKELGIDAPDQPPAAPPI
jgi:hypothetical protein